MFVMFVLPLKQWPWCEHFVLHVSGLGYACITTWPLTLSLSRFKKHLFFVGAFTAFLLSGNIVGIAFGSSMAL